MSGYLTRIIDGVHVVGYMVLAMSVICSAVPTRTPMWYNPCSGSQLTTDHTIPPPEPSLDQTIRSLNFSMKEFKSHLELLITKFTQANRIPSSIIRAFEDYHPHGIPKISTALVYRPSEDQAKTLETYHSLARIAVFLEAVQGYERNPDSSLYRHLLVTKAALYSMLCDLKAYCYHNNYRITHQVTHGVRHEMFRRMNNDFRRSLYIHMVIRDTVRYMSVIIADFDFFETDSS